MRQQQPENRLSDSIGLEQHHDVEDDPPAAAELARRQTRDEDAWFR
jgi:hypothetical protein